MPTGIEVKQPIAAKELAWELYLIALRLTRASVFVSLGEQAPADAVATVISASIRDVLTRNELLRAHVYREELVFRVWAATMSTASREVTRELFSCFVQDTFFKGRDGDSATECREKLKALYNQRRSLYGNAVGRDAETNPFGVSEGMVAARLFAINAVLPSAVQLGAVPMLGRFLLQNETQAVFATLQQHVGKYEILSSATV